MGSQKTKNGRVRTKAAMTRTKTPQCTDCRGTGWACNKGTRRSGRCKWNERGHVQRWHNKKCPNGCRQRCNRNPGRRRLTEKDIPRSLYHSGTQIVARRRLLAGICTPSEEAELMKLFE